MHRALALFSACVAMASAFAPSLPAGGLAQRTSAVSGEPSKRRVERALGAKVPSCAQRNGVAAPRREIASGPGRVGTADLGPDKPRITCRACSTLAVGRAACGKRRVFVVGRREERGAQTGARSAKDALAYARRRFGSPYANVVHMLVHAHAPRTIAAVGGAAVGVYCRLLEVCSASAALEPAPVTCELRGQA